MTNEEKAHNICSETSCIGLSCEQCRYVTAIKMAEWKDQQFIETAQEDAENYVKGVAKANPDLSVSVLKMLETAYIAGRNRIK